MIEAIRNYFIQCPLIESDGVVGVDYLPPEATSYAIYAPGDVNGGYIKKWVGGGGIKQYSFIFASRFDYSLETVQNIQNSNFYHELQYWIEQNNKNRILPDVQGAQKIEVVQTGTLSLVDESQRRAEYQMIARLIYDV